MAAPDRGRGQPDCKFKEQCRNPACWFKHPAERVRPSCRDKEKCTDGNCKYDHPPGWNAAEVMPRQTELAAPSKSKSCRFALECTRADCKYDHPFGWNATKPSSSGVQTQVDDTGRAPAQAQREVQKPADRAIIGRGGEAFNSLPGISGAREHVAKKERAETAGGVELEQGVKGAVAANARIYVHAQEQGGGDAVRGDLRITPKAEPLNASLCLCLEVRCTKRHAFPCQYGSECQRMGADKAGCQRRHLPFDSLLRWVLLRKNRNVPTDAIQLALKEIDALCRRAESEVRKYEQSDNGDSTASGQLQALKASHKELVNQRSVAEYALGRAVSRICGNSAIPAKIVSAASDSIKRELYRLRSLLPALAERRNIEKALSSHQFLVVKGSTGSGKSTQLPQYIADAPAFWGMQVRKGQLPFFFVYQLHP